MLGLLISNEVSRTVHSNTGVNPVAIFNLLLNTGRLRSPIVAAGAGTKMLTAANLIDTMRQLASGGQDPLTLTARVTPVSASGTVTIASGTGAITAIINGVSIAITWATSDTVSAALLAAAINASVNALVAGFVTATSAAGVVTITAAEKGLQANAITLSATGTGATASVARLAGGTHGTVTSYVY